MCRPSLRCGSVPAALMSTSFCGVFSMASTTKSTALRVDLLYVPALAVWPMRMSAMPDSAVVATSGAVLTPSPQPPLSFCAETSHLIGRSISGSVRAILACCAVVVWATAVRIECGASADKALAASMARILGLIVRPSLRLERARPPEALREADRNRDIAGHGKVELGQLRLVSQADLLD